jgi:hypothetical protein
MPVVCARNDRRRPDKVDYKYDHRNRKQWSPPAK